MAARAATFAMKVVRSKLEWLASWWQCLANAFVVDKPNKTRDADRVKEDFSTKEFNTLNEDLGLVRDLTSRTAM